MDRIQKKRLLRWAGYGAACGIFLLLLPLTLPVVLGVAVAAALETWVIWLQQCTGMGRKLSSFLVVTAALLLSGGMALWAGNALLRKLMSFSDRLPLLLESAAGLWERVRRPLSDLPLPAEASKALISAGQSMLESGGTLARELYAKAFSMMSRFLSALPGTLLFLLTLILSSYFAAGELPRLRELLQLFLPPEVSRRGRDLLRSLRRALGAWARAQLHLMAVTFSVLFPGFLLLRIDAPLLSSLGVAALDALPLLGTGILLLPWALCSILGGSTRLGLGLMGLYGITSLLRNILEPHFLGKQLGVSPLLTLTALYAGWRAGGVKGMILLPALTMAGIHLVSTLRSPRPEAARRALPAVQVKYREK